MDDLNFTYTNEFLHHGIQGQKWGVRNGPPYPLQKAKETIKKAAEKAADKAKDVSKKSYESLKTSYSEAKKKTINSASKTARAVAKLAKNITVGNSSYKSFLALTNNIPISIIAGAAMTIGTGDIKGEVKDLVDNARGLKMNSKELINARKSIKEYEKEHSGWLDSFATDDVTVGYDKMLSPKNETDSYSEAEKNRKAMGMSPEQWERYQEFMSK